MSKHYHSPQLRFLKKNINMSNKYVKIMSNKTNENTIILKQLLQYQSDVNTKVYIVTIWTNTLIYREFLLKLSQLTRDLSGNTAFNLTKNARVINAK